MNLPNTLALVELGAVDSRVELTVFANAPFLIDMVEILSQLDPGREFLVEIPVLPQLGIGELVDRADAVDARARIAIPVPNASEVVTGFDKASFVAVFAQVIEKVDAGETGPNEHNVEIRCAVLCLGSHNRSPRFARPSFMERCCPDVPDVSPSNGRLAAGH